MPEQVLAAIEEVTKGNAMAEVAMRAGGSQSLARG